jgi:hypothetical protein
VFDATITAISLISSLYANVANVCQFKKKNTVTPDLGHCHKDHPLFDVFPVIFPVSQ